MPAFAGSTSDKLSNADRPSLLSLPSCPNPDSATRRRVPSSPVNYLSHAAAFLDDPALATGAVLPDLLSAIDRKCRVRKRHVDRVLAEDDLPPGQCSIVRGLAEHLDDDHWFHGTEAFLTTSSATARLLREALPGDQTHRVGFLGHILVELFLDAWIEKQRPGTVDRFYAAFASVDPAVAEAAVNRCASRPTDRLAGFWGRFVGERFLADYVTDEGLFRRVNHVLKRVGLPQLKDSLLETLSDARHLTEARASELLPRRVVAET